MSPTIVTKDNRVFLVTGTPGGSRIISTTLQLLLNVLTYDMSIAEATYAPRFHHQWKPDILFLEKGFSSDTKDILSSMGYTLSKSRGMGSAQSILKINDQLFGSSDPRKPGAKTAGY